jgi:hypothetical protein
VIGLFFALLAQSALPPGNRDVSEQDVRDAGKNIAARTFGEVTPKDLTVDGGVFECSVTGDDGRRFSVVINDGGSRGYVDPGSGQVNTWAAPVSVTSMPATLLAGYQFNLGGGNADREYHGSTKAAGAPLGPTVDLILSNVTPPSDNDTARFAIRIGGLRPRSLHSWSGLL